MSKASKTPAWPKLEPVYGSSYCLYSVVENKLETLYKNQEKLLEALRLIYVELRGEDL